ncbi:hypothetical protein [Collimonas humicola]|uniref:hypothetical protein n=1 Tax=Collimonas humicola TaxID=2825886 RepID=UPI001B8BFE5E|nr:hypothetical protein [Collimonas humicola]
MTAMKKDDPTGLRGVNGFSYDAVRRSEREGRSAGSAPRTRGTIRIAIVAIALSVLATYGVLYFILPPPASQQVKVK